MQDQEPSAPVYGASRFYVGESGSRYFSWQNSAALFRGRINSHKFKDFIKPTDTVVDFGCGGGGLLANLDCARRIGVEINPAARRSAEALGIECRASTGELPNCVADVVVSDHALEHVSHPIAALGELRRLLKPAGILRLCVPIDNWRHERTYDPDDINHHLHTWTPQLLGNSLSEAGFKVVEIHARINAWPGRWTVACYGRLPYWAFRSVCYVYGVCTGKGWEILATATPMQGCEAGTGT